MGTFDTLWMHLVQKKKKKPICFGRGQKLSENIVSENAGLLKNACKHDIS